MYRVDQKKKAVDSKYINKTEKIGGTWNNYEQLLIK